MDYSQVISSAISSDEECGVNLEDDAGFQNFFFEAEGTPEKYDGQNTTPAEPPDWRSVKKTALDYLKKTKDLKLASVLAQSVLNTEGISKYSECLRGIADAVQAYWQSIFPLLDEDDGDPMERVSALGYLVDSSFVLTSLREYPLAKSKILGVVSLKQIERASDSSMEKGENDIDLSQIKAIFKDSDQEELIQIYQDAGHCRDHLESISKVFSDNSGSSFSTPDFDPLLNLLKQLRSALEKHAEISVSVAAAVGEEADESGEQGQNSSTQEQTFQSGQNLLSFSSQQAKVRSREDVEKCIDLICEYFAEYEPSSPVPILLNRAKKLLHLDFVDIVKEIAPDALDQIRRLGGLSNDN